MPTSPILTTTRGRFPSLDVLVNRQQMSNARAHQSDDPQKVASENSKLTGYVTARALGSVLQLVDAQTLEAVLEGIAELPGLTEEQITAAEALVIPR